MRPCLCIIAILYAAGSHLALAQDNFHAYWYGYTSRSAVQWIPFADGDSLGTVTFHGHEIPTSAGFLPTAYACTQTWTQRAGRHIGGSTAICTYVDDDGDWYRTTFTQPDPTAWEGTMNCVEGTGKYEGIQCHGGHYRGIASSGPGWFRGESLGTIVLRN